MKALIGSKKIRVKATEADLMKSLKKYVEDSVSKYRRDSRFYDLTPDQRKKIDRVEKQMIDIIEKERRKVQSNRIGVESSMSKIGEKSINFNVSVPVKLKVKFLEDSVNPNRKEMFITYDSFPGSKKLLDEIKKKLMSSMPKEWDKGDYAEAVGDREISFNADLSEGRYEI